MASQSFKRSWNSNSRPKSKRNHRLQFLDGYTLRLQLIYVAARAYIPYSWGSMPKLSKCWYNTGSTVRRYSFWILWQAERTGLRWELLWNIKLENVEAWNVRILYVPLMIAIWHPASTVPLHISQYIMILVSFVTVTLTDVELRANVARDDVFSLNSYHGFAKCINFSNKRYASCST